MRLIKQWYFDKAAEQLDELNNIQATPIPELGERPGGGGYVVSIFHRPTPDASPERSNGRDSHEFFNNWQGPAKKFRFHVTLGRWLSPMSPSITKPILVTAYSKALGSCTEPGGSRRSVSVNLKRR